MITEQQAAELKPSDKIKHKKYGLCVFNHVVNHWGDGEWEFSSIKIIINADISQYVTTNFDEDNYRVHDNLPDQDCIDNKTIYLWGYLSVEEYDLSMLDMLEPNEVGFDTGFETELGNAIRVGDRVQYWPDHSTTFVSTIGVSEIGIGGMEHVVINDDGGKSSLDKFGYGLTVVEQGVDKYGRKFKKEL